MGPGPTSLSRIFDIKPPCPASWGATPRSTKTDPKTPQPISALKNRAEYQHIRSSKLRPFSFNPAQEKATSKREKHNPITQGLAGAGNGIRTRDTKLGKLVLYQLSYARFLKF
jgi:hypothetical protein